MDPANAQCQMGYPPQPFIGIKIGWMGTCVQYGISTALLPLFFNTTAVNKKTGCDSNSKIGDEDLLTPLQTAHLQQVHTFLHRFIVAHLTTAATQLASASS